MQMMLCLGLDARCEKEAVLSVGIIRPVVRGMDSNMSKSEHMEFNSGTYRGKVEGLEMVPELKCC